MRYIFKKIGIFVLTIFAISILVFLAFQIIPGDPTTRMLGTQATPEKIAALRSQLGLDRPVLERYFTWLGNFLHGDFGVSYSYNMPVHELLSGKIQIICVNATLMKITSIPALLRTKLEALQ